MHQIFADLCPFESFCKLLAACCLNVIMCKFYYIIGIFFANNRSFGHMGKILFFFSSPEHKVLMVSYCGQSMSVVRRQQLL